MNRGKKGKQTFAKRLKKARAKLAPKNQLNNKPKYISKAERLQLELESTEEGLNTKQEQNNVQDHNTEEQSN